MSCNENCISRSLVPPNTLFLSDWKQFDVICALAGMGFPWSKLGLLCKEEVSIFETDPQQLIRKVSEIKDVYGFNSVCVISICLAFPQVLCSNVDGLLDDLKILLLDNNLLSSVEGNVNAVLELCEKIKLFYDSGCEMGKVGELMGKSKNIFIEYSKEELINKIEFFSEFKVQKDQVGLLLLSRPEILGFELVDRVISVKGFLKHFGIGEKEIKSLEQKYPHVFGRNKIGNLPRIMRAMNLGEWFFKMIQNGDHSLLNTYSILSTEDLDKHYTEGLTKILAKRTSVYRITKLNFLHSIGIGENRFAIKALPKLHSNRGELQQRFDYLLESGIEYSTLCAMLALTTRILNQKQSYLQEKVEYLCTEMGSSVQFLDVFPGYLCHDLENRIKPRYRFHKWLKEQGYCGKDYAVATIIASSEKTFLARISRFNDAARKWQELSSR